MYGLERDTVAIVTGAAGGIGLGIVSLLAAHGVNIACWDQEDADFSKPLEACADAGVKGLAVPVDVRDRDSATNAASKSEALGKVRYGVNCAGIDHLQRSIEVSNRDWTNVLDVNLSGVFFSCLAEYEVMKTDGGAIVNIASVSGLVVNRGCDPHIGYSASKAGVINMSRGLAVEWVPQAIRVNSVSPGYTRTDMTAHNPPEMNASFMAQTPMGRMAEVPEIAAPVAFLLGAGASFVNGVNLVVDGGLLAW